MLRCREMSVHLQPKPGIAVALLSRSAEVGVADTAPSQRRSLMAPRTGQVFASEDAIG